MHAASNPIGFGHAIVKARFLTEPSLLAKMFGKNRLFIPSRLEDNPYLDIEEYRASLMELDPFTRSQLLEGDWSEYSGGFFRREWFPVIDNPPADIEKRVRAWDLAATEAKAGRDPDWSAGVLLGRTKDKQYIVLDVVRIRETPLGVQALRRRCAGRDGKGGSIYCQEEGGGSGKEVA